MRFLLIIIKRRENNTRTCESLPHFKKKALTPPGRTPSGLRRSQVETNPFHNNFLATTTWLQGIWEMTFFGDR